MTTIASELIRLGACTEAIEWAERRRSWRRAWEDCPRGDWLLWYAERAGANRRDLVRAQAACARLVLYLVPTGEDRPRLAIEAAEAWADAAPGSEAPGAAWAAAVAARAAAWAPAAAGAERAAGAAAWAAASAASAEWAAGAEAAAATAVEAAAEAGAARAEMHCRCARAVRRCVPFPGAPAEGAT